MRAILEERLGAAGADAEFELERTGGGVFEISVDGELKFSKRALGRFPSEAEVAAVV